MAAERGAPLGCTVTLSANAGVMIAWHGLRIWVDALHSRKTERFSTVTPAEWEQIRRADDLTPPDLIFFTHCHADHYSRELTAKAHALWPRAILALPERAFADQLLVCGEETELSLGPVTARFMRLPHEGEAYAGVAHYGVLLLDGTSGILAAGDCATASPVLTERLRGARVDLAVLDFPWLTLRRGREYLEQVMRPEHLFLCHLPFPEDDCRDYLAAARWSAQRSPLPDIRLLERPLQRESV